MPKFVIERDIPGVGNLQPRELQAISQNPAVCFRSPARRSHGCIASDTGQDLLQYIAPDEKTVREHAHQGGFPANRISEIKTMIDPTTAE